MQMDQMFQPKDTDWLNGYKNKTQIYIYGPQETHFRPKDTYRLKVRGWKNIFHANRNQKKAGCMIFLIPCWILFARILLRIFVSMLISDIGL